MINSWLIFGGIGMLFVGIYAFYYSRGKGKSIFLAMGLITWIVAIAIKTLMDITITKSFLSLIDPKYLLISECIYFGLRTGILESGLSYIFILKMHRKFEYNDIISFGLGFGGIEAIMLGISNISNILLFIFMPSTLEQIPVEQRMIIERQLNQSTLNIFAPIIERAVTIVIHVFATILVFLAIKYGIKYLVLSIIYKSIVDGIIPLLNPLLSNPTIYNVYLAEAPFITICIISILILKLVDFRKYFDR